MGKLLEVSVARKSCLAPPKYEKNGGTFDPKCLEKAVNARKVNAKKA